MKQSSVNIIWIGLLGFASGFPLLFSSEILKAYMLTSGGSYQHLAWIGLLSLPYMFSWLWAPWVDYLTNRCIVSHRTLISIFFILTAVLIRMFAIFNPVFSLAHVIALGFVLSSMSATQDHLVEKYRRLLLPKKHWSIGVSYSMLAFRFAIMLSGGGGMVFADQYGWSQLFTISAGLMFVMGALASQMPVVGFKRSNTIRAQYQMSVNAAKELLYNRSKLLFLWAYRLSVFWFEAMTLVFLIKYVGMSLSDVGWTLKVIGTIGVVCGAAATHFVLKHWQMESVFLCVLFSQMALAVVFYLLYASALLTSYVLPMVIAGCAIQGAIGIVSGVWFMKACRAETASFNFSLWYGISMSGRALLSPVANYVVRDYGWEAFFLLGAIISYFSLWVGCRYFAQKSLTSDLTIGAQTPA